MEEKGYYFKERKFMEGKIPIEHLAKIKEYSENRICKVYGRNGEKFGNGFFCNIPLNKSEIIRILITNSHVLGENDLKEGEVIKFTLNNDKKFHNIKIDKERRIYINYKYDVTFLEIKENDGIKGESFFEIDYQIFDYPEIYLNLEIYLLFYSGRRGFTFSQGLLKKIEEEDESGNILLHSCNSEVGSSGCPLINFSNNKIIGIHFGQWKYGKYNTGNLLKEPIKEFTNYVNYIPIVRLKKPDFSTKSILKEAIDYGEEIKREIIFDKKKNIKGWLMKMIY